MALWIDAVPVWGRSLMLCMAATSDGLRHMLGFAEATLQDAAAVRQLLQDFRERGLCVDRGLLCITSGQAQLTRALADSLGTHLRQQHCQMAKRERVVSYLADEDRRSVRGAITHAFQLPELREAHAALMRIHAELQPRNRSAAQWLLWDLDQTLTLHRTGLYEMLSPSLRGTRSLAHATRQLLRQLRGLRHWLPPQERHAQLALLLPVMESRMRRLAHASHLLPTRAALFAEDVPPAALGGATLDACMQSTAPAWRALIAFIYKCRQPVTAPQDGGRNLRILATISFATVSFATVSFATVSFATVSLYLWTRSTI